MKTHKIYIIHGILGNKLEYCKMRKKLRKNDFETTVFTYKSRKERIMEVSENLYRQIKADNPDTVSFIAHSLGGLILRGLLTFSANDTDFPKIQRVIMIATPNQGATAGNYMNKYAIFKSVMGVNLRDVMNDEQSLARTLPVDFNAEVGIIAGSRGKKKGYNPFIGEDNDGEIKPDETKLGTETDFIALIANHISVLRKNETIRQTVHFMQYGRFDHSKLPK